MPMALQLGTGLCSSRRPQAGGGDTPANALTLNGQVLTLNGQTLTMGA